MTGRLEASTTATGGSNVQAYSFGWTPAGDLDWRLDSHNGQAEEFEHDSLHRLVESEVAGVVRSYGYDALGNFTSKDGVGSYTYDAEGTRLLYTSDAATSTTYSYDDNGAVEHFGSTDIQWTSFGKVDQIVQGAASRSFSYDADGARVVRRSDEEFTVTAHSLYERRISEKGELQELRLKAPSATGAVVAEFRYKPAPEPIGKTKAPDFVRAETRYIHDDHLGSAGLTTDENGAEVERIAFDPWGRARDADDWNVYLADDATDELPIGFTGHQAELDGGLINMRGRMYDPRLGRFMSVDPIIENATNVQTWNSYSYVQNRPLSAVDPSGLGADDGGGGDASPDWNVDPGNPDGCDFLTEEGGCGKNITVHTSSASSAGLPGNDAPIGGNWGGGDGSGAGTRGGNELGGEGGLQDLAAASQIKDELAYKDLVRRLGSIHQFKGLRRAGGCEDDTCRALEGIAGEGGSIKLPPAATEDAYDALDEGREANKGLPAAEAVATWVARLMSGGTEEMILLAIEGDLPNPLDRGGPAIGAPKGAGKNNTPRSTVPRGKNGDFLPDPAATGRSHTTVGTREGRRGSYRQGASFDAEGEFKGLTDVTTHGRGHPDPHFHPAKGSDSIAHGPHSLPSAEGF